MQLKRQHFFLQGMAISLGVASICFLLLLLMGKNHEDPDAVAAGNQVFSIPQSPAKIVLSAENAMTTLCWNKLVGVATPSNGYFEARTAEGDTVKLAVQRPPGGNSRVVIESTAKGGENERLTQQLHDAVLAIQR